MKNGRIGRLTAELNHRNELVIRIPLKLICEPTVIWREIEFHRDNLTARQEQVLTCVLNGKTNKEIAEELGVAERTIKFHVSRLLHIFGVVSRTALLHGMMPEKVTKIMVQ